MGRLARNVGGEYIAELTDLLLVAGWHTGPVHVGLGYYCLFVDPEIHSDFGSVMRNMLSAYDRARVRRVKNINWYCGMIFET